MVTIIKMDKSNRMLRIGFGKHDNIFFFRIDLWYLGIRFKFNEKSNKEEVNPFYEKIKAPEYLVGNIKVNEYELRMLFVNHNNNFKDFEFIDLENGTTHKYKHGEGIFPICRSLSLSYELTKELL